jgi:AraC family transcriptional regulator
VSAIVEKALWYIENRYGSEIGLDDLCEHVGVSRSHLSRSFPAATGTSLSAYLRGRRLTVAARQLAAGAPDILSVALDACYNSHEAFTRAFRDQFGLTPEQVRANGTIDGMRLVEPIRMDDSLYVEMAQPRILDGQPMLIAGLAENHEFATPETIPAQWQRFNAYLGNIPKADPEAAFGVLMGVFDDTEGFRCLTGLAVSDVSDLQPELTAIRLPAQRYAVFTHRGHVSKMRASVHTIFNRMVPQLEFEVGDFPSFIERYGEEFNPETGVGDVELWVPLKAA